MKIVVNNEQERLLARKFINAINEYCSIEEVIDPEFLDHNQCRILRYELAHQRVVVDQLEPEIILEDTDFITGTCRICGCRTSGVYEDYGVVTYSNYLQLMSPEEQSNWICDECQRCLCSCCGEHLTINDFNFDDECVYCLYDIPDVY
jgi:hypothetical protein